jgi:TfoX/Sxy family transcriptional regulator of competence genes
MQEMIAERLRSALSGQKGLTEKRMFGGYCFMVRGNMVCAIGRASFIFRVGKDCEPQALTRRGAKPMQSNGRRYPGFVAVDPEHCNDRELADWIALSQAYVADLPPKQAKQKANRRKAR